MSTMVYADEVNDPAELSTSSTTSADADVSDRELRHGRRSWSSRSPSAFEPERFEDTYRNQVLDLIERKAAGEEIVVGRRRRPPRRRWSTSWPPSRRACAEAKEARKRHPTAKAAGDEADDDEDEASSRQPRARGTAKAAKATKATKAAKAAPSASRPGPGCPRSAHAVEIEGRTLQLSNLDKVLYPEVGFTKAEVIDYYARVAPAMLPHLGDRGVTLRRFPDGVDGGSFFEKRCPGHRPEWVRHGAGSRRPQGRHRLLLPRLVAPRWCGRPTWPRSRSTPRWPGPPTSRRPTMVVFDLDPGAPADDPRVRRRGARHPPRARAASTWRASPRRRAPRACRSTCRSTRRPHPRAGLRFAQAVAQVLERAQPDRRGVQHDARSCAPARCFVDWSQNSRHKTTVAAYSLRARPRPTVSTPVSWDEVEAARRRRRRSRSRPPTCSTGSTTHGDLFAGALTAEQRLPGGS